jgi:LmbE family N-acetylglucosaminyl deacetylase
MDAVALVADYLRLLNMPESIALPPATAPGGTCVIFAPHPDDECIIGALPLRLQREAGMTIVNVPVTLGGKAERKAARRTELAAACAVLDFTIAEPSAQCFDQVKPETRLGQQIYWDGMVTKTVALLERLRPDIIVAPHRLDVHATHVGTHLLLLDALGRMPPGYRVRLAFAEYYQAQQDPNLLVESPASDLARLVQGLICHAGEIARNPYHLRLPAWMIDNARRGEELIGGVGAEAGKIPFATLYQIGTWENGGYSLTPEDRILLADHSAASLIGVA